MDEIDEQLLNHLRRDARLTWRELGDRVGLSANAVRDRVHALQTRGAIRGFHADIDTMEAGRRVAAIIDIKLRSPDDAARLEQLLSEQACVEEAYHLTGRADYLLRVACVDTGEIDSLLTTIKQHGGVRESETRVILRTLR